MEEEKELQISLTQKDNANKYMTEYYDRLQRFNSYLDEVGQDKSLLSAEIVRNTIDYYLNDVSLFLLVALQYGLTNDTEVTLSHEGYSVFLGEGFFINRCYTLLKINRESDFVTRFMDDLLPVVMKLLKSYNANIYSRLMNNRASDLLSKFKFFHSTCISSVTDLIEEARLSASCIGMAILNTEEISEISDKINLLVGSENRFTLTMQHLEKVICFKKEKKIYFENLLSEMYEKNLNRLTNTVIQDIGKQDEKLALSDVEILESFTNDKNNGLSSEELLFMKEEICVMKGTIQATLLLEGNKENSNSLLRLGLNSEDFTEEERKFLGHNL